jgi:hypothetical protein
MKILIHSNGWWRYYLVDNKREANMRDVQFNDVKPEFRIFFVPHPEKKTRLTPIEGFYIYSEEV